MAYFAVAICEPVTAIGSHGYVTLFFCALKRVKIRRQGHRRLTHSSPSHLHYF